MSHPLDHSFSIHRPGVVARERLPVKRPEDYNTPSPWPPTSQAKPSGKKDFAYAIPENELFGILVSRLNDTRTAELIIEKATKGETLYIGMCDVLTLARSKWDPETFRSLHDAFLNVPTGRPLRRLQKLMGFEETAQVSQADLVLKTLRRAAAKKLRVAFYGGQPGKLDLLMKHLTRRFPELQVATAICSSEVKLKSDEKSQLFKMLNSAAPDIIFTGLETADQLTCVREISLRAKGVIVSVGSAFRELSVIPERYKDTVSAPTKRWPSTILKALKPLS